MSATTAPDGSASSVDTAALASPRRRLRVRVQGMVQGVGFRPYVHRLAGELGLDGFVLNDVQGVLLEVEGAAAGVERFLERLVAEPPPLASVEHVEPSEIAPTGETGFRIAASSGVRAGFPAAGPSARGRVRGAESSAALAPAALVSPDTATCADCLAELLDPGDRRYRYPFINCTNCGPRFTIVARRPLRPRADDDGGVRHVRALSRRVREPRRPALSRPAQRVPRTCGPTARLVGAMGVESATARCRADRGGHLRDGAIVAVKGLGGFHLACRADRRRRSRRCARASTARTGRSR